MEYVTHGFVPQQKCFSITLQFACAENIK